MVAKGSVSVHPIGNSTTNASILWWRVACRSLWQVVVAITLLVAPAGWVENAAADEASEAEHEQRVFFESKVRPLLIEHCWSCHGEEKQNGSLRLDSLAAIEAGGDSGASIDRANLDASLLLQAVRYESLEMPPSGKLPDDEVAILERWVKSGAYWPGGSTGDAPMVARKRGEITDADRDWWAFKPVRDPRVPSTSDAPSGWDVNPIDAFLWRSMSAAGLSPAGQADPVALARRVAFDLTGLPPTAEQVERFVGDPSSEGYARLVDELLDSQHYGERWARHWLDLVRYADSDGYRADGYRPDAWRYRDYVINALNEDKPYDRFVQEQLAGDELFPGDPQAKVATGYLRHWIYEYNNRDAPGQWKTIIEDVTDVTGDVFLGFGMQCAKCHDHKFDPIPQRDYYRLQAFFAPIMPVDVTVESAGERSQHESDLAKWEAATAQKRQELEAILDKYRPKAVVTAVEKFPLDIQEIYYRDASKRSPGEEQLVYLLQRQVEFEYERLDAKFNAQDKERVLALRREIAAHDAIKPAALPVAQTVRDVGMHAPETYMPKGPKGSVAPGYMSVLDPNDAAIDPLPDLPSTGRRAALAKWLTRSDHPLTARLIANRVWQHHFGRGIALNPSDLGRVGGEPTHPELLDFLASRLVEQGWSLKGLHRLICNSAAYRQASSHPRFDEYQKIDPTNRYYWRWGSRRLDAEQIRDAILAVSGKIDLKAGGEGVPTDSNRRTIYTRVMRNSRDPLLDVFDLPAFFASEPSRNTTTTPVQSLMLLNSPQLIQASEAFAGRLGVVSSDPAAAIDRLWELAYSRLPTSDERDAAIGFLQSQAEVIQRSKEEAKTEDLTLGKMRYRDGQAVSIAPAEKPMRMSVGDRPELDLGEFTIEAFVEPRSVYPSGAVRTVVSKREGKSGEKGWVFGITGKSSRRKPQTLVLQMWGKKLDGSTGEAAVFSDHHLEMNKPYYLSAAVTMAKPTDVRNAGSQTAGDQVANATNGDQKVVGTPGEVRFYVKDLSNDDEPLLVATVPHDIIGDLENDGDLRIGGRQEGEGDFDGLIDGVRLSRGVLGQEELLFSSEKVTPATVGYWRFESDPGVRRDSSPNGLDIAEVELDSRNDDPLAAAMIDLCHAVFNSNEFLYLP